MQTFNLEYTTPEGSKRIAPVDAVDAQIEPGDQAAALALMIIHINDRLASMREHIDRQTKQIFALRDDIKKLSDRVDDLTFEAGSVDAEEPDVHPVEAQAEFNMYEPVVL